MKHIKDMTLEEINNELHYLFSERSDRFDFNRIENLLEKRDILKDKGIVFHYSESITPAEIQVAAKILKAILSKNVYMNNVDRLDCPKPNEIKGSWHDIPNALLTNESSHFFYIHVPGYGKMRYTLKNNRQIVDISSTLALKTAQDTLKSIKDNICLDNMKEIDSLTSSFILINSSILSFFLGKDQESSSVSYSKKYNPCFLERERILHLKGLVSDHTDLINDILKIRIEEQTGYSASLDLSKESEDLLNKIQVCQRYFLSDFALQVKFHST